MREVDLFGPRNLLQDGFESKVVITRVPQSLVLLFELRRHEIEFFQRGLDLADLLDVVEAMAEADEMLVEAAGGFEGR